VRPKFRYKERDEEKPKNMLRAWQKQKLKSSQKMKKAKKKKLGKEEEWS